jgi:predicted phage-related endonuclease
LESLARIYGTSAKGLPTVEFSPKYETDLRRIALLQGKISEASAEIKSYEKEIEARSVRIAEVMKDHEHGVLETTSDKLLIDFVTKTSRRTDTDALKKNHPTVYEDVMKTSLSRKLRVSAAPL